MQPMSRQSTALGIIDWSRLDDESRERVLTRPAVSADASIREQAASIIEQVRSDGDAALSRLTVELDGVEIDEFQVTPAEFDAAARQLDDRALDAIDMAVANVRAFHSAQVPRDIEVETRPGVLCQRVSRPIDSVGLYVPAGSAPLPSTAIMLAVPAALAGCPQRVMCTPPDREGRACPAVLVAARRAGVDTVFKLGGAQAIAAMAYGTDSVPRVARIFGPGNAWVTAAKTLVAMDPAGAAIDMPAGPSEVLVIADGNADANYVAADLLSQAEHGADSQVLLLTTSVETARRVVTATEEQLERLPRRDIAERAIGHSRVIVCADLDTAVDVANRYAPEHLILQVDDPRALLPAVRNAGSVFLGRWSPESVGDYMSGTNHVLPTYGAARSYSGLGLDQFLRQMTVQELSREGLTNIGAAVIDLAELEGLDGHAEAIRCRLPELGAGE